MNRILFLSALDFKEKSIQVIRETPLAYVRHGWDVTFVVARDTSELGDYFYEPVLSPPGVRVQRFDWPFRWLRDSLAKRGWGLLLKLMLKVAATVVVLRLTLRGWRELRRGGKVDVVYGYESHGVLAAALLRGLLCLTRRSDKPCFISRFQGTKLAAAVEKKRYLKLLANFEHLLANWLPCDLCIMTDDGTRGRRLLRNIGARCRKICFYVNGFYPDTKAVVADVDWSSLGISEHDCVILTVSRLVMWKRLDRALRVFARILESSPAQLDGERLKLVVVGGGNCRDKYEQLARELGVADRVVFTGAVPHTSVPAFYKRADMFFSFYDLSNVGNPLLEAIHHKKIIFTLNNGDTRRWIRHRRNGFLFSPIDEHLPDEVVAAFRELHDDPALRSRLENGVGELAERKLWSWQNRLDTEIDAVASLSKPPHWHNSKKPHFTDRKSK